MLTFVNSRRAVAGKPAINLGGESLLTEFRTQRSLDFYLTGHRLGDLRRYAERGMDFFPKGLFPIPPDSYGATHCFVIPARENAGNAGN